MCVWKLKFLIAFQINFENLYFFQKRIVFKHVLRFAKTLYKRDLARKVPNHSLFSETLSLCINIYSNEIKFNTLQSDFTVEINVLQNEFAV